MTDAKALGQLQVSPALLEKAARVKLVVCDLDGTLLNEKKIISQRNIDTIAKANAKGVAVTICSGRIFTMLEAYVRTLQLQTPLISCNGAVVASPQGEILRGVNMDRDDLYKALTFAFNKELDCMIICDEACYYTANSIRVQYFIQYNRIAQEQKLDLIELIELPLPQKKVDEAWVREHFPQFMELQLRKILIYDLTYKKYGMAAEFLNNHTGLTVSSSDPGLLDIIPHGVNKGTGLALLAGHFGYAPEEVMAIGDYDNDESMFDWAGVPVAMGNAVEALKKKALYITESNTKDGVAEAIERLILAQK